MVEGEGDRVAEVFDKVEVEGNGVEEGDYNSKGVVIATTTTVTTIGTLQAPWTQTSVRVTPMP